MMRYRIRDIPHRSGDGGEIIVQRRRFGLWWTRWRGRYIWKGGRDDALMEAQAAKRNMQYQEGDS